MKRRKLLLINSILLTIYVAVSIPYYLSTGDTLEGHLIAAALYLWFVIGHEIMMLIALLGQWLSFFYKSRGWMIFSLWFVFLGGILFFVSLFVIIPIMVLNLIAMGRRPKTFEYTE